MRSFKDTQRWTNVSETHMKGTSPVGQEPWIRHVDVGLTITKKNHPSVVTILKYLHVQEMRQRGRHIRLKASNARILPTVPMRAFAQNSQSGGGESFIESCQQDRKSVV